MTRKKNNIITKASLSVGEGDRDKNLEEGKRSHEERRLTVRVRGKCCRVSPEPKKSPCKLSEKQGTQDPRGLESGKERRWKHTQQGEKEKKQGVLNSFRLTPPRGFVTEIHADTRNSQNMD